MVFVESGSFFLKHPGLVLCKGPLEKIFDPLALFQMVHTGNDTSPGTADGDGISRKGFVGGQRIKESVAEVPPFHPGISLLHDGQHDTGEGLDKVGRCTAVQTEMGQLAPSDIQIVAAP